MVKLPEYHVLNFFYDNEGGCALTARVHGKRYHVIVNPNDLKDRSKRGKKIRQEYQRLLQQVQADASGEEGGHQTAPLFVQDDEGEDGEEPDDKDSGVDVDSEDSSEGDDDEHSVEPSKALQRWILRPLASELSSQAPKSKQGKKETVQDWYHCSTLFYHLALSNGKLTPIEDEESASLSKRIETLIPSIALPKYIQKLEIPSHAASSMTVLAEHEGPDPVPLHPTLVQLDGKEYFLKVVDPDQPGPTKRELQVIRKIEDEGLHNEMRVPQLRGLVHWDAHKGKNRMMGFLMDSISDPKPLTTMLDSDIPEEKRTKWAEESARMVDLLHQHDIVWGDAKGDNFMVDKDDNLWIIDFGGSYTEGWVDPELRDTEEGDDQGMRRLVNGLQDPEKNTVGEDDDQEDDGMMEGEAEVMHMQHSEEHPTSLKKRKKGDATKKAEAEAEAEEEEEEEKPAKKVKKSSASNKENEEEEETKIENGDAEPEKYCYCNGPDSGRMLACDGKQCKQEWFHFDCIGIKEAPDSKKWYCDDCLAVEEWKSMHYNCSRDS